MPDQNSDKEDKKAWASLGQGVGVAAVTIAMTFGMVVGIGKLGGKIIDAVKGEPTTTLKVDNPQLVEDFKGACKDVTVKKTGEGYTLTVPGKSMPPGCRNV